jgi:hypothetical protein
MICSKLSISLPYGFNPSGLPALLENYNYHFFIQIHFLRVFVHQICLFSTDSQSFAYEKNSALTAKSTSRRLLRTKTLTKRRNMKIIIQIIQKNALELSSPNLPEVHQRAKVLRTRSFLLKGI